MWLQAPGKGSLWTVDPTNRISLLQALKKTHHQSLETYINEHAVLNTRRLSRLGYSLVSSRSVFRYGLFCLSVIGDLTVLLRLMEIWSHRPRDFAWRLVELDQSTLFVSK